MIYIQRECGALFFSNTLNELKILAKLGITFVTSTLPRNGLSCLAFASYFNFSIAFSSYCRTNSCFCKLMI